MFLESHAVSAIHIALTQLAAIDGGKCSFYLGKLSPQMKLRFS